MSNGTRQIPKRKILMKLFRNGFFEMYIHIYIYIHGLFYINTNQSIPLYTHTLKTYIYKHICLWRKLSLCQFIYQISLDEIAPYFAILDRWSELCIVKASCWYTQNYPLYFPSKSTKKHKKDTNMWNRSLARIDVPLPQITVESCFMAHFLAFAMVHVTHRLKFDNLS